MMFLEKIWIKTVKKTEYQSKLDKHVKTEQPDNFCNCARERRQAWVFLSFVATV